MPNVKLLLKESVKHVGRVGDVVEVSPGFARNYLLPQGLAVEPTVGNIKKIEARRQEIERQEREKRSQQESLIKQLEGVEVTLERRTNDRGHPQGRRERNSRTDSDCLNRCSMKKTGGHCGESRIAAPAFLLEAFQVVRRSIPENRSLLKTINSHLWRGCV